MDKTTNPEQASRPNRFLDDPDFAFFKLVGVFVQPPPILYHYTSLNGLLGIVESERMRASHIRYLNDQSEATIIWQSILQRINERIGLARDTNERDFFDRIASLAQYGRLSNEFVASFSDKGDDLSQWRAYCPGGAGLSIGFHSEALRSQWVSNPTGEKGAFVGAQLLRVKYLEEKDTDSLDAAINDLIAAASRFSGIKDFEGRVITREDAFVRCLALINPTYKHRAFSEESEWRLILSKPHKPMPHQRFRPGQSTLIPFIEVDLNRNLDFSHCVPYMISRVIVGPTPNRDLSLEALRHLFVSKGQPEVEVIPSSIPYRHW